MTIFILLIVALTSETAYIIVNLNRPPRISRELEYLLALRRVYQPESGREIYDDLKRLDCKIHQIENSTYLNDIELRDYPAFLIMAEGRDVAMGQGFSFEWNNGFLTWEEDLMLYTETPYGIIGWNTTYMTHEFIPGLTHKERFRKMVSRQFEIQSEHTLFDIELHVRKDDALLLGIYFLDDIGVRWRGKGIYVKLETKDPNFYWHDLAGLERPDIRGSRSCWVIKVPAEGLEVWVDRDTGEVIGGEQTR